jgi:Domain of unknown function (DUF5076)
MWSVNLLTGGSSLSELPKPPDLSSDPDATEILRVWVINQELQCSLYTGAFEETSTWGVLLADLIRTITSALKDNEGKDPHESLDQIMTALQDELAEDPEASDLES